MLTQAQQRYIQTIPEEKTVKIYPYDPKLKDIAEEFIQKAHLGDPNLEVLFMGASGLGISGQGDIDLYALNPTRDLNKYSLRLTEQFGEPKSKSQTSIAWEFESEGHGVEFYLTDPNSPEMQEQIKIFKMLKDNPELLKEYEQLKQECDGLPFREYQRRKYEFYNKILEK